MTTTRLLARHLAREIERDEIKEIGGAKMDPTCTPINTLTHTQTHEYGLPDIDWDGDDSARHD